MGTDLEGGFGVEARGRLRESQLQLSGLRVFCHTNFFHLPTLSVLDHGRDSGSAAYASLIFSGILDSTLLISWAPKPVAVRLCFGLVNPGPMGPCNVEIGAPIEGLRSRGCDAVAEAMMSYLLQR